MKLKRFLAAFLSLVCMFTMVCCTAVSGFAASVQLPKKVTSKTPYGSGTSEYTFENGNIVSAGTASDDAKLYPFMIASNAKGQNVSLMQYGNVSPYSTIDIFAALANSSLIKTLKPNAIVIVLNTPAAGDVAYFIFTYKDGKVTNVRYAEQTASQLNTNRAIVIYDVKYSYDSSGNLKGLTESYSGNELPGIECWGNKFTYNNGKISTAYGVTDGGEYKASSPTFDDKGRVKSFKASDNTQADSVKGTVSVTYSNGKPSSVKFTGTNSKYYNSTTNFSYSNGNLSKVSISNNDKGSFTYQYTY